MLEKSAKKKGLQPNTVSTTRFVCPNCSLNKGKRSRSRGRYYVYETTYNCRFKCGCGNTIVVKKHKNDIGVTNNLSVAKLKDKLDL